MANTYINPMVAVTFNTEKPYSTSPKVLIPQRLMEMTAMRNIVILAQAGIGGFQYSMVITAAMISTGIITRHWIA